MNDRMKEVQEELRAMRIDALRWRAFLKSGYLRHLGSANLINSSNEDPLYAHMGMEIWTKFGEDEKDPRVIEENKIMQGLLIQYADKMREILGD